MEPQPQLDEQHPGFSFVRNDSRLTASTLTITGQMKIAGLEIQPSDDLDTLALELVAALSKIVERNRWRGKNYISGYTPSEAYARV